MKKVIAIGVMAMAVPFGALASEFCDRQYTLAYEIMKARQIGYTQEQINEAAPSDIGRSIARLAFSVGKVPFSETIAYSHQFGKLVQEKCEEATSGLDI